MATLIEQPDSECWGRAFALPDDEKDGILAALDVREQGGYERVDLEVFPADGTSPLRALTFLARPDNPDWLGPAPLEEIARLVATAVGPSGPNVEYVLELARALCAMGGRCQHTFALAALVTKQGQASKAGG